MIEFGNTAESTEAIFPVFRIVLSAGISMNKEVHDKAEQSEP